jgi:hypothetical protein
MNKQMLQTDTFFQSFGLVIFLRVFCHKIIDFRNLSCYLSKTEVFGPTARHKLLSLSSLGPLSELSLGCVGLSRGLLGSLGALLGCLRGVLEPTRAQGSRREWKSKNHEKPLVFQDFWTPRQL